jgi:hypothetical protein
MNDNLGPLPPGYTQHMTEGGKYFYSHRPTRTTQWEDPREPIDYHQWQMSKLKSKKNPVNKTKKNRYMEKKKKRSKKKDIEFQKRYLEVRKILREREVERQRLADEAAERQRLADVAAERQRLADVAQREAENNNIPVAPRWSVEAAMAQYAAEGGITMGDGGRFVTNEHADPEVVRKVNFLNALRLRLWGSYPGEPRAESFLSNNRNYPPPALPIAVMGHGGSKKRRRKKKTKKKRRNKKRRNKRRKTRRKKY